MGVEGPHSIACRRLMGQPERTAAVETNSQECRPTERCGPQRLERQRGQQNPHDALEVGLHGRTMRRDGCGRCQRFLPCLRVPLTEIPTYALWVERDRVDIYKHIVRPATPARDPGL